MGDATDADEAEERLEEEVSSDEAERELDEEAPNDPEAERAPGATGATGEPAAEEDDETLQDLLLRFFTEKIEGKSVALFRIAYGLLAIWMSLGILLNLERYFTDTGIVPWSVVGEWAWSSWSLLYLAPQSSGYVWFLAVLGLVASVTLTLGVFARTSVFLIWVLHISFQHRNPYILNSGDRLFMIVAGLAVFLPLAQRWSLEAWWRAKKKLQALPPPSIWSTRVIQMQIAYVYWFSCFAKLNHERWLEGKALRDVLASPVYAEWATYVDFWPLVYAMTWGTLILEFAWPSLVWFARARPWVLLSGITFHLAIDLLMLIPTFSYIMIITYALFLTDEETDRLVGRLRLRPTRPANPAPA